MTLAMKIRVNKGFKLDLMLAKLSEERTLNSDGSVRISGFGLLDEYKSYFLTAISAEGQSHAFLRSVVGQAINAEQNLNESTFLKHCNRIANKTIRDDLRAYKVLFPVWGSRGLIAGRRKWSDVTINFDVNPDTVFARRAKRARAKQFQKLVKRKSDATKDFEDLPLAVCSVRAISPRDAFEKAENAISKELGLYSMHSGRGKFVINNGPDQPFNTVLLAPHMTVHNTTGAISTDMYWYNRWPNRLAEKHRSLEDIVKIKDFAESVRLKLRKLPWREDAEQSLARYFEAFAQCDLEASFLDGWRLLEAIGGHPREKSETLIRRAAWFYNEREEYYQIGLHLMHRRNLISHGRPVRDDNNEGLAFQMKTFVTPLFHAYLTNYFNFKNVEEFWSFCDLPVDKAVRDRQAHLLNCSARFRDEK